MKTLIRTLKNAAAVGIFTAIFAVPHLVSAANRTFASVTPSPAAASVAAGTASATNSIVTVINGSSASTRFVGTALLTASVSPADPTVTVSMNPTNLTFPNANTTLTSMLTVTTTAGTPAGTYIVSIVANTNLPAQSTITPVTNTFTLTVGSGPAFVPQTIWNPAGANINWSTAGNWTGNAVPVSSNDVDFFDAGAVPAQGTVDNVVDSSLTIGSLTYGQTNNFHTTLINPGVTLTIGGDANGLVAGTGTDNGNSQVTVNTITGTHGTLAVTNKNSNIYISQSHPTAKDAIANAQATLDLAGLDNFTATVSRLLVGVDISSALRGASGVLNLAKTNLIIATVGSVSPQIDVGDNTQSQGSPAIPSVLLLGQTNSIFADSIAVGRGKTDLTGASIAFNGIFTSPNANFYGTNGTTSRVGTWTIGDGFGSKGFATDNVTVHGTCDFSLGTVSALVNTMSVGSGASTAIGSGADVPGTGTLTFNSGTIDVNILQVGLSQTAVGTGTVNANGGTLLVNTLLELANGTGSSGTLNIANATVTANTGIIVGGGTANINITGSTLNVTNRTAIIGAVGSPINSLSVSNSTLNLAVQQSLAPSIAVSTLTVGGTANTINISSVPLLSGFPTQFPIIQYGLNGGSSSGDLTTFVLGTLPSASPIPYGAFLSNNVANNSIDIVFTSGPSVPALTWDGTPTGNWDTTTANWRPKSGPDTAYGQENFVTFDDSLSGTPNVNLTTTLLPGSLMVSNSAANYTFSGAGNISGIAGLSKQGTGALVLDNSGSNDFSGGINIAGGTIQVGNNDANGNLPLGSVTDNGALVFNRANNITVMSLLSGAGTLTQSNTSILTLGGSNTLFAGTITVAQGTLQTGNTNALGAATGVIVNNGATLDVNGQALFANGSVPPVTVSGVGVGGNGAIVNNSTNNLTKTLHIVTLAADSTFGGIGNWDIRNSSAKGATADAQLNGAFNLTKTGINSVILTGVTIDGGLGNINVQSGSMTISGNTTALISSLGNPSATITIFSNATLTLDTIGNIPSKNFVLTNSGTLKCTGTNILNSPITLAGTGNNGITVNSGAQFTINGVISGPGSLSKNGTSALFLTTGNTYTGSTIVSGGTLALYGGSDGSIASSTNVNITAGATIDVSGRSDGTFTLASGQTLIGGVSGTNVPPISGAINGALVVSPGAILSPGTGFGNTNEAVGTLSVSSNLLLQGTTLMDVSATNGYDQIDAAAITNGGALVVSNNFSGIITNGQAFQLFVASNGVYNAGSFSSVTLPTVAGVTWTNTLSSNGTITAGVAGSGPAAQPHITSVSLSGTSLVISGTNGTAGRQFNVLTSTNLTLPLSLWKTNTTGTFNTGNFSVTNTVSPTDPHNFYILQVP